ncbi:2,3-bisphosphoglycerate-dependent phosphoglycerate mutase [Candidatus Woesearchaeota archaeon]|nr:2,3-bisphosphoglycerate-dependent phosphoglycerate mutase [Candidatus Woesearchaeota archaeon]
MKLHIYLFRHGQSYFNREKKFTGWIDSGLTPKGVEDAKKVAEKLKGKRIDVAFQTHLSRSKDTLKNVLKYHPECKVIITNDKMLERNYGSLCGLSHESLVSVKGKELYNSLVKSKKIPLMKGFDKAHMIELLGTAYKQMIRRSYNVPPPNGESVAMVRERVMSFIKELVAFMKREKVNVAISAHGNSMRPFRQYFEKLTVKEMMELENPWDDYFEYVIEA